MTADPLAILGRINLVLSLAALVALTLRAPVRQWFGPQRAYAIWLIAPLALLGGLMPAPRGSGPQRMLEVAGDGVRTFLSETPSIHDLMLALWFGGFCLSAVLAARRHGRFIKETRAGRAGPAIIGVIHPRLVTPSDFKAQFTPRAQILIRAHERAHMERCDARWNALVALLQALLWFNPIVHCAARAMKLDQELACDAMVIDRFPKDRQIYARALLAAQAPGAASPLACHWASAQAHPLVTRLDAIAHQPLSIGRDGLWIALSLCLWTGALVSAWAAQPPDRTLDRHAIQYVRYTGGIPGASAAVWRIAIDPD